MTEIRRLAIAHGKAPGKLAFASRTGIKEHQWSGIYWSKWSDALAEAGPSSNALQARFNTVDVLSQIVQACRHYKRVPSSAQFRLYRRTNTLFPSHNTISGHFPTCAALLRVLHQLVDGWEEYQDMAPMLAEAPASHLIDTSPNSAHKAEGLVYLLKSGEHYKIGRSDDIERRVKQIKISLAEEVTLVHTITTDDPPGIEAYWHRRFAPFRANGEWFRLGKNEIAAFKKRRYQ